MLMIRADQMEVLDQYMLKKYEDLVLANLKNGYPEEYNALGEDGVRDKIHYGIERARRYDIEIEADVSRYIDLMFRFGWDFDTDRNLPWAASILQDESLEAGFVKLDLLDAEARKHLS